MPLTRRLILQKARHHPTKKALTDCQHTVSGTISLPSRGTFHHSLTVLIHYRSQASYQTYRTVPADSQQIPRAHCYSGTPRTPKHTHFTYRTLTYSGRRFHTTSATHALKAGGKKVDHQRRPHNPTHNTPTKASRCMQFSQKFAFVRHYSQNHNCFLTHQVLRCFTSPATPAQL